jgi:hypothetical protein
MGPAAREARRIRAGAAAGNPRTSTVAVLEDEADERVAFMRHIVDLRGK